MGDSVFFYAFAMLAILGALGTVLLRSAVHCSLALMTSLLGVAGLYLTQGAEFLFAVQIVLYIGGIMVLFLFVIMLLGAEGLRRQGTALPWQPWLAGVLGVLFVAALGYTLFIHGGQFMAGGTLAAGPVTTLGADFGGPKAIGLELFQNYLLPFELTSFLLLVGMIGAVVLTRDATGRTADPSASSAKRVVPERRP